MQVMLCIQSHLHTSLSKLQEAFLDSPHPKVSQVSSHQSPFPTPFPVRTLTFRAVIFTIGMHLELTDSCAYTDKFCMRETVSRCDDFKLSTGSGCKNQDSKAKKDTKTKLGESGGVSSPDWLS